jgi:hypothetical protein
MVRIGGGTSWSIRLTLIRPIVRLNWSQTTKPGLSADYSPQHPFWSFPPHLLNIEFAEYKSTVKKD